MIAITFCCTWNVGYSLSPLPLISFHVLSLFLRSHRLIARSRRIRKKKGMDIFVFFFLPRAAIILKLILKTSFNYPCYYCVNKKTIPHWLLILRKIIIFTLQEFWRVFCRGYLWTNIISSEDPTSFMFICCVNLFRIWKKSRGMKARRWSDALKNGNRECEAAVYHVPLMQVPSSGQPRQGSEMRNLKDISFVQKCQTRAVFTLL